MKNIEGYSKLSKTQKIDWVVENYLQNNLALKEELISFWHRDIATQQKLDEPLPIIFFHFQ
jgi:hydroxymethylglutaryl-CoA reductase